MAGHKNYYSFNERADLEKVLKYGFTNGVVNGREAQLIAKYYREEFGYGEIKLERELIKYCKKHEPSFNQVLEADSISKWVRDAMAYPIRESKEIKITHSEIKEIKKIKDLKNRKILYCSLVVAKYIGKSNDTKTKKYFLKDDRVAQVIEILDFRLSENDVFDAVYEFTKLGLTDVYAVDRECSLFKFASDTGSVAIIINDPKIAMEKYRAFFGGDVDYCANGCGTEIIKTGNKKKYCEECAKQKEKLRKAELKRRQKGAK